MNFIIRVLVNAAALWVATLLVPQISVGGPQPLVTLVIVAVIFGLVNAVIKPIVAALGCWIYIITLGLFTFVVNALMLLLTSWIAGQVGVPFHVDGFIPALIGAVIISIVSFLLSAFLKEEHERQ